jgi:hypothetical protein
VPRPVHTAHECDERRFASGTLAFAMRLSVLGRDLEDVATQRTPRPDPEIRGSSYGVGPSPESVDEQIESLLVSLQETDVGRTHPYPAADQPLRPHRKRRARRWRGWVALPASPPRRGEPRAASRYDLVFAVIAVVLGLAVGVLTVLFVNG